MSIEWIYHKDRKILYISYINLSAPQMLDQIREAAKIIAATRSQDNLTLTDITGCNIDNKFIDLAKEQSKTSLLLTKKAAIIGIYGIRKMVLDMINSVSPKQRKPFATKQEAMDWLAE